MEMLWRFEKSGSQFLLVEVDTKDRSYSVDVGAMTLGMTIWCSTRYIPNFCQSLDPMRYLFNRRIRPSKSKNNITLQYSGQVCYRSLPDFISSCGNFRGQVDCLRLVQALLQDLEIVVIENINLTGIREERKRVESSNL